MALSNDLITQFVKATQDKQQTNKESTAYGTIVVSDGTEYVQLDGSDLLTPISSTTVVHDGDRVIVTIKNHTAVVTGDLTNPSASDKDVQNIDKEVKEIGTQVSQFEQVVADKVTTQQLQTQIARIDELETETAKIETLETKVAKIDDLEADIAKIDDLEADIAKIDTLEADIATFKNTTTESLNTVNATINNLDTTYATIDKLNATNANVAELETKKLDATEANAKYATIENLNATNANVTELNAKKLDAETANATYATIKNLDATNANVTELNAKKLDAETANVTYATIDFSNITKAAIEELFTESGIIKDLVMKDGSVTGELVGVTIKGDLVEAGTLKADKLVIRDSKDGLYYKLNFDAGTFKEGEAIPENGLHGSVIVAKSVTAEKVAVTDLVAFGATIGGFNITNNAIYSGAKAGVASSSAGIYQDKEGQFAVGDNTNFVKFYKNQNGEYILDISADNISFGSEKTTVQSLSEAVKTNTDDLSKYINETKIALGDLQGQIDGSIMTHFKECDPLPSKDNKTGKNDPAETWINTDAANGKDDLKNNHLGDLYYNTISGYCFRWQVQNNEYFWNRITDVDVTKALADAAKAQDTADGKRRVFVNTGVGNDVPEPPYDVGDLWSQGSTGDLMRCKTAKTEGQTYAAVDWVKASKYTDDAKANEVADNLVKAEARITQNAEAIELRATKTEVTNHVNAINNNLAGNYYNKTQTESLIKVESDKIALQATKIEETNAKIDNLEVGGRNYLLESDKTYTITMTGSTGYNYVILDISPELPKLDPSVRTFTISYDAKSQNGGTRLQGYLRASSSASAMNSSPDMGISTTSWARYSRVATLNDGWTVADIATFYARIQGTEDDTVYVKNIKVEVGNKRTDWSPAPEDIKTELTTNYYTKSESDAKLQVESDRITSTVNKLTTVETTANSASTAANAASKAANSANTAAANAQSTANTANTNATNAQTAINNLSIGNRNFILNSDRTLVNTPTQLKQSVYPDPVSTFSPDMLTSFKSGDTIDMSIEIKVDEDITIGTTNPWIGLQLTFYYDKNGTSTAVYPTCGISGAANVAALNDETQFPKGKWVRIHNHYKLPGNPTSWVGVTWLIRDMIGTVSTRRPHVCRSNKPVDWSPAPEDIDASFTTVTTRISEAETKIDQNSEAITLRATKTEVEEVKTTATNAKNAIDNLELGGRNMFPNSDFSRKVKVTTWDTEKNGDYIAAEWGGHNGGVANPTTCYHAHLEELDGEWVYNFTKETETWLGVSSPFLEDLKPGEQYTFSCEIRKPAGSLNSISGGIHHHIDSSTSKNFYSGQYAFVNTLDDTWQKFSKTFTIVDNFVVNENSKALLYVYGHKGVGTVYMRKPKFEKGNKTSDWSPAPEDIKTELTTNYYNKTQTDAQIKVASDAINLKVTSVETTANNAATAASNAATAASNAATKAQTAQNTANSASATATTANNTANTAKNTADTAKSTADAAQEDIDNLEIGGKNLIIQSMFANTDARLPIPTNNTSYTINEAGYVITDRININYGEIYTLSAQKEITGYLALGYFTEDDIYTTRPIMYTTFNQKYTDTITIPDGYSYCRISFMEADKNFIKFEKGNKATDWTPAPEDIETEVTTVATRVADLEVSSTNITASIKSIEEIQKNTTDTLGNINTDIATLSKTVESKMDSESVNIAIKSELANGVSKVQTATGYRFDEEGLTISKTGADTSTNIDEDGMSIYRTNDNEEVLTADSDGVNAFNLHARTYLIIGETSRFEDYIQNSKKRTGCFWIGGE